MYICVQYLCMGVCMYICMCERTLCDACDGCNVFYVNKVCNACDVFNACVYVVDAV